LTMPVRTICTWAVRVPPEQKEHPTPQQGQADWKKASGVTPRAKNSEIKRACQSI
jgi:hypothetical protein